jgi:hypothetical protein
MSLILIGNLTAGIANGAKFIRLGAILGSVGALGAVLGWLPPLFLDFLRLRISFTS